MIPATTRRAASKTCALNRIVASGYGRAQADRFTQLWQRHITDLLTYANAVASHNAPAQQVARAALMTDADAYGSWLATASQGRIRANNAAASVRMHVGELMRQLDAQRATFAGSPEFNAAGAQINANTTALAQAMGAIVGPQKGAEFQSAWADHVDGLMATRPRSPAATGPARPPPRTG